MYRGLALIGALLATLLAGCAATKEGFYANRQEASNVALCNALSGAEDKEDHSFVRDLRSELGRRGVTDADCTSLMLKQAFAIGVGVLAVGAAAYAASNSGGGGGYNGYGVSYGADWDAFHNQWGQLAWACREISSGQFTNAERCRGKPMTDYRWPGK